VLVNIEDVGGEPLHGYAVAHVLLFFSLEIKPFHVLSSGGTYFLLRREIQTVRCGLLSMHTRVIA
jgi:hypothetical protein